MLKQKNHLASVLAGIFVVVIVVIGGAWLLAQLFGLL